MADDLVNRPMHYRGQKYEAIDIIEDYELGFHLGNVIKYVLRSGKKFETIRDLRKAIWYLERYIDKLNVASEEEEK